MQVMEAVGVGTGLLGPQSRRRACVALGRVIPPSFCRIPRAGLRLQSEACLSGRVLAHSPN